MPKNQSRLKGIYRHFKHIKKNWKFFFKSVTFAVLVCFISARNTNRARTEREHQPSEDGTNRADHRLNGEREHRQPQLAKIADSPPQQQLLKIWERFADNRRNCTADYWRQTRIVNSLMMNSFPACSGWESSGFGLNPCHWEPLACIPCKCWRYH